MHLTILHGHWYGSIHCTVLKHHVMRSVMRSVIVDLVVQPVGRVGFTKGYPSLGNCLVSANTNSSLAKTDVVLNGYIQTG